MHVNLDLPGFEDENGIALPYIVHMTDDNTILAIRRNWNQDDQAKKKKHFFTHFTMIPGLGFYGYGYLHLIGGLTKTATSSMRQLIDAGTLRTCQVVSRHTVSVSLHLTSLLHQVNGEK